MLLGVYILYGIHISSITTIIRFSLFATWGDPLSYSGIQKWG